MDSHDLVNICTGCCVAGEEEEVMTFRLEGLIISARNDLGDTARPSLNMLALRTQPIKVARAIRNG